MEKQSISTQLQQKNTIDLFISNTKLLMYEVCYETVEGYYERAKKYKEICKSWTIREKGEVINKLNKLQMDLYQRMLSVEKLQGGFITEI